MIIVAPCISCKHLDDDSLNGRPLRCVAFPEGIPEPIEMGTHRHLIPFPGDQGIRWEPVDDTAINIEWTPAERAWISGETEQSPYSE